MFKREIKTSFERNRKRIVRLAKEKARIFVDYF